MAGIKFECRGYMTTGPRKGRGKRSWWGPFTTKWGGKQNRPTGK